MNSENDVHIVYLVYFLFNRLRKKVYNSCVFVCFLKPDFLLNLFIKKYLENSESYNEGYLRETCPKQSQYLVFLSIWLPLLW